MKSKIFIFATLILVVFLFVITSCDNFLNTKNKTTININLDLSKILKTSRNETTSNPTEYILKVFAYNAATYKPKDEIQNLPLLTQSENKVDINGNVKASLDVEIGLNVIFVAKLYQGKSEKPLYAGNSKVIKIKATDNKVHLVLTSENTDLDVDILVHEHTFATDWTSNATHHWHAATCGHTTEISDKAEHTFGNWTVTKEPTETEEGRNERTCTICAYVDSVVLQPAPEGFVYVKGDTIEGSLPSWLPEDVTDEYKGVFIEGRTVTLSDFYMGKYEVTQEEYASVMQGQNVTVNGTEYTLASAPSYCKEESTEYTLFPGDVQTKRPVEGVSWYDAVWYCNALSAKECLTKAYNIEVTTVNSYYGHITDANVSLVENSNGYRLPTRAEWEYAARGGDPTSVDWNYTFSGADTAEGVSYKSGRNAGFDSVGWYAYNSITGITGDTKPTSGGQGNGTHQVGKKAANRLGLYDMSGNVMEWSYDWSGSVTTGTEFNPTGAMTGTERIYLGGSWRTTANGSYVSLYYDTTPDVALSPGLGFRVVRTATEVIENLAHTHKFATDWTSNATHHWHAATCEHTTEVSDKAEHTYTNGVCICGMREMVLIPAGTFQMGSNAGNDDNKPVHQVTITKDFYMGKYEVTQAEYEKYCSYGESNPSSTYGDGDNYPAYYVSWYDALVYCNKRSIAEGLTPCYSISGNTDPSKWGTVPTSSDSTWDAVVCYWNANGYRLPTEAEWEYAARAGDDTVSSLTWAGTNSSSKLGEYAWYSINSSSKTHPVGTKKANAFGLYDMSGNVKEWCWNWWTNSYNTGTEDGSDPTGAASGSSRVNRGGSLYYGADNASVSYRGYDNPYYRRNYYLGFRVVRPATE